MQARRIVRWPAIALLLASACSSVPTPYSRQSEHAATLTPEAPTEGTAPVAATLRRVRVRVFLDEDYRGQQRDPETRVQNAFAQASAYLRPEAGFEFEIVDIVPWDRRGSDLQVALEELKALHADGDVDLVVGFVTSTRLWTASFFDLGRAEILGKHAVLRGSNDLAEKRHLEQSLNLLGTSKREEVYRRRRDHKEAALLLHEWGHTVGALHIEDPTSFMHPLHDVRVDRFSPTVVRVLQAGHAWHRAATVEERKAVVAELVAAVIALDTPEREAQTKEGLLSFVRRYEVDDEAELASAPEPAPSSSSPAAVLPVGPSASLSATESKLLAEAIDEMAAGAHQSALSRLKRLAARHPEDAFVQRTTCLASQQQSLVSAGRGNACARCRRAVRDDAVCVLVEAQLAAQARDEARVAELIVEARLRLTRASPPSRAEWANVARLFAALRMVADAEHAATQAKSDPSAGEIRRWAQQMRRRVGMPSPPAPGAVPEGTDREFLRAVDAIYESADQGQYKESKRLLTAALERFEDNPGLLALQCDILARTGARARARKACERSLAIFDASTIGHSSMAMISARSGKLALAVGHARRALELDPDHQPTWRLLAQLYRHAGMHDERASLEAEFKKQFGAPLDAPTN